MLKPSNYIFTLYKGEYDDEDMSIDKETLHKALLEPFFISLDINVKPDNGDES